MPKTNFTNNVTVLLAAWLQSMASHNHRGLDEDGSAPKITQNDLSADIVALLQSIAQVQRTINVIQSNGQIRSNIFGGNGQDGIFTATASRNLLDDGVYNFTNFTISNGFTVACRGGLVRINCTGNVVINGSLVGEPTTHNRIASGFYSTSDFPYNLGASLRGSSGANGRHATDETGLQTLLGQGGKPATTIVISALGPIAIGPTGRIICAGERGQDGTILIGNHSCPGAGGGTGGALILQSLTSVSQSGDVDISGGAGAEGIGPNAEGGGGASGGWAIFQAPTVTDNSSRILLLGGAAGISKGDRRFRGTPGGSFANRGGQLGTAGGDGTYRKVQSINFFQY